MSKAKQLKGYLEIWLQSKAMRFASAPFGSRGKNWCNWLNDGWDIRETLTPLFLDVAREAEQLGIDSTNVLRLIYPIDGPRETLGAAAVVVERILAKTDTQVPPTVYYWTLEQIAQNCGRTKRWAEDYTEELGERDGGDRRNGYTWKSDNPKVQDFIVRHTTLSV